MKFEWDPRKEEINIRKHGITFEQASYVFTDPFALNKYDAEHAEQESGTTRRSAHIQRPTWNRAGKNY